MDNKKNIKAPVGTTLICKGWHQEAALRMLMNNLDSGSVASPNRETEGMKDGSDAVADWPLLNALLNTASGDSISERRTYLLLEGHDGLPPLLMSETGVNSGFMIPQYTAAALVAENKVLSHPASVDSIPTCVGQEDHVSMGSISAHKLLNIFYNVEHVLTIELLTSAQALDFREPLKPGKGVVASHKLIRQHIPHLYEDSYFQEMITIALQHIHSGKLVEAVEKECGVLR